MTEQNQGTQQAGQAGTSAPAGQASSAAATSAPANLTLDRHGKKIEVPVEQAKALAQKGLDYETKMAELSQQRQALQAEAARLEDYQELRAKLNSNPELKRAFLATLKDPQMVLRALDGTGAAATDGGQPAAAGDNGQFAQVMDKISRVEQQIEARDARDNAAAIQAAIQGELVKYPWLKGADGGVSGLGALAQRSVIAHLHANRGDSIAAAVAVVADEYRVAMENDAAAKLERQKQTDRLQTGGLVGGIPIPTMTEKPTKKSFEDGSLHKKALEVGLKIFGG